MADAYHELKLRRVLIPAAPRTCGRAGIFARNTIKLISTQDYL